MTAAQLLADQQVVFRDFPTEHITLGATAYEALVLDSREGNDYGLGGKSNEDFHRLALERSAVGAMPVEGDLATFRAKVYKIVRVERDDAAASVTIDIAAAVSSQQS